MNLTVGQNQNINFSSRVTIKRKALDEIGRPEVIAAAEMVKKELKNDGKKYHIVIGVLVGRIHLLGDYAVKLTNRFDFLSPSVSRDKFIRGLTGYCWDNVVGPNEIKNEILHTINVLIKEKEDIKRVKNNK